MDNDKRSELRKDEAAISDGDAKSKPPAKSTLDPKDQTGPAGDPAEGKPGGETYPA